eukprot:5498320-Prymnesium_polylepis.2
MVMCRNAHIDCHVGWRQDRAAFGRLLLVWRRHIIDCTEVGCARSRRTGLLRQEASTRVGIPRLWIARTKTIQTK